MNFSCRARAPTLPPAGFLGARALRDPPVSEVSPRVIGEWRPCGSPPDDDLHRPWVPGRIRAATRHARPVERAGPLCGSLLGLARERLCVHASPSTPPTCRCPPHTPYAQVSQRFHAGGLASALPAVDPQPAPQRGVSSASAPELPRVVHRGGRKVGEVVRDLVWMGA